MEMKVFKSRTNTLNNRRSFCFIYSFIWEAAFEVIKVELHLFKENVHVSVITKAGEESQYIIMATR